MTEPQTGEETAAEKPATGSKRKPASQGESAIELLKEDHKKVRKLLSELVRAEEPGTRRRLLREIYEEVSIHVAVEEEIFYPEFCDAANSKEGEKLYFEAIEEHRTVDELVMPDLFDTNPGSPMFAGRAKVLKDLIEHHAEEEEKQMFPKAKKAFTTDQLRDLGARIEKRKKELKRDPEARDREEARAEEAREEQHAR
jgi:hemerythrin superfamily protein